MRRRHRRRGMASVVKLSPHCEQVGPATPSVDSKSSEINSPKLNQCVNLQLMPSTELVKKDSCSHLETNQGWSVVKHRCRN